MIKATLCALKIWKKSFSKSR